MFVNYQDPIKPPKRQLQPQIYLNYRPLSKLSLDLKVMPRSQKVISSFCV